jgi:hypothetical protein
MGDGGVPHGVDGSGIDDGNGHRPATSANDGCKIPFRIMPRHPFSCSREDTADIVNPPGSNSVHSEQPPGPVAEH